VDFGYFIIIRKGQEKDDSIGLCLGFSSID